ncbi:MAG: bifunctional diaminohydroxyphosphoribosylaminopyrimidine deaminase/5-amino-6-(5-phosphoribosylamino)uracil reductase RibD [Candidatus Pelagibacter sp.]
MSSKKDKFTNKDRFYMNLAINLARGQDGLTGLNPSVGCVIVKNKKIISHAVTSINGRPHAETIALNKNKKNNKGSTVYLTLEPCTHYGKTPPCTNALVKSKVKKVIYSIDDRDQRTFKKAKKILKSNKIITKSGLLVKESKNLYKSYNYIKKNKFPYITGKLACSSNLYILKNNTHITNEHSRKVSHLLRFKNQGILTTYKTVNSDNPKLTCRIEGLEKFSPVKIIIDKNLKIKINSYIINNSMKFKTIIFHNSKNSSKIKLLKKKGIKLINFTLDSNKNFDLKKIFKKIYNLGIHTLLIEAGKILTCNIISQKIFNEFYLFKSDKILNNKDKIKVFDVKKQLDKEFKNKYFVNTYLDKDKLIHYY